jgi:uncharacterized protein YjbJ (UPF0337 family)
MADQSNNNSQNVNELPSTFTALKDQFLGATKEVIGAVFNENLQQSGAEQRMLGEKELQEIREASPRRESNWSAPWSASDAPIMNDPLHTKSVPSEPASTWFGSWFGGSSQPSSNVSAPSEPSTMTAMKDQYVGATKEVAGAVFNQDLQNAGAEQRIRGEQDLRDLNQAAPNNQSNWSAPWSVLNEAKKEWSEQPTEPSKIAAMKDQLVGATKEVLGAVFSDNLHNAGLEQRIHGEREYEKAVMAQETQANWDQNVGAVKQTAGDVLGNKKMQGEGWAQQREAEIKKVLNA